MGRVLSSSSRIVSSSQFFPGLLSEELLWDVLDTSIQLHYPTWLKGSPPPTKKKSVPLTQLPLMRQQPTDEAHLNPETFPLVLDVYWMTHVLLYHKAGPLSKAHAQCYGVVSGDKHV